MSKANLSLGILYYEKGYYEQALPCLKKAWERGPRGLYPALALSHLFILGGEIEQALPFCEGLLKALDLPGNHELRQVADLGRLYYLISKELLARREFSCHEIAYKVGHLLTKGDPDPLLAMADEASRMGEAEASGRILRFIESAMRD